MKSRKSGVRQRDEAPIFLGSIGRVSPLIAAAALGALPVGCVTPLPEGPDFIPVAQRHSVRVPDELPVAEAAFRYMFNRNASGQQQMASVYCLSFTLMGGEAWVESDPPADFIRRFSDVPIPVKPASGCRTDARTITVDKDSGKDGLTFRIDYVSCSSQDDCVVGGGYQESGLSASGNVYTLKRQDGQWHVEHDVMEWIS
ncbi:hypothetical protein D3874_19045 [Oleomonas cavernae]|uniref:Uncharacterized protein n=1 Tax=Oleomonas cavernae TaxID=2320859 RepID=A0A418WFM5_9PROT|nr:hypothetical protein [Oleomonas cavernae]RJF88821.1 hypothetical protein D3874_19045 [Oleomonas cavernae]